MADGAERLVIGEFAAAKVVGGVLRIRVVDKTYQPHERHMIEIYNGREALACLRELRCPDVEDQAF